MVYSFVFFIFAKIAGNNLLFLAHKFYVFAHRIYFILS
ncbi:putative membrane protein [Bacteroides fragilis str. 1007-1-F |uniref:Membrane protein n=1 Tax=Bacteroides fragilis str. 3783N1-6 TaxID=1339310 RepID=A0AB73ASF9_BACFG|nr:putative membrane protein [Bacteroides fragilis str. 1007-1-F \